MWDVYLKKCRCTCLRVPKNKQKVPNDREETTRKRLSSKSRPRRQTNSPNSVLSINEGNDSQCNRVMKTYVG